MDRDRFLKLANAAASEEQRAMFMQQHFRLNTQLKIEECRGCFRGGIGNCVGFRCKTPAFLSFVSREPLGNVELGVIGSLLPGVGYSGDNVCFISMISCARPQQQGDPNLGLCEEACRINLNWQMALASSRVFVLLGADSAHLATGERLGSLKDVRGSWYESRNSLGAKQFMFLADYPSLDNKQLLQQQFEQLGSLLHYAWATQMQELYPGSSFEHQMSYEQVCDVVANDVKQALLRIPAERRTEEYMRIMTRICGGRDGAGLAARALWDNAMAVKCGLDVSGPEWWLPKTT